jgi:hypothetical protein
MEMSNVEAEVEQAKRLVGFTVEDAHLSEDGETFALTLRRGKQWLTVWVDCDPEGNGPGHLQIEEPKS